MNDKDIEKRLKEEPVQIPESLEPPKVVDKLKKVNKDAEFVARGGDNSDAARAAWDVERMKRANAGAPGGSNNHSKGNKSKKVSKAKIFVPIAAAAAIFLSVGLGVLWEKSIQKKSSDKGEKVSTEAVVKSSENGFVTGYEKAYAQVQNYRAYQSRYDYNDYGYEYSWDGGKEEEAFTEASVADEASGVSEGAAPSNIQSNNGVQNLPGDNGIGTGTPDFTDTNERTDGVHEDDIVKTDGNYIYAYNASKEQIGIYSAKDGKTEKASKINLLDTNLQNTSMYVAGDRLVVVGSTHGETAYGLLKWDETRCYIYDISDPKNPKELASKTQTGTFAQSRMVGDKLYLFSTAQVKAEDVRKKKPETYIPKVDGELIPTDHIITLDESLSMAYTVLSAVDVSKGEVLDSRGFFGTNDDIYVSQNNIYITAAEYNYSNWRSTYKTRMLKLGYADGSFGDNKSTSFEGSILNHYSIDEYNDYVRICYTSSNSSNGILVFDKDLKKVGVLKNLGEGETVKSCRFMGNTAYFVTYRQTDPLFSVDLTDPEDPTLLGYLKIPGFSAYLHPISDKLLLGIGYTTNEWDGTENVKLQMYDTSDPSDVKVKDTLILEKYYSAAVLSNSKNFMYNKKTGEFGTVFTDNGHVDEQFYWDEYEGDLPELPEEEATPGEASPTNAGPDLDNTVYYAYDVFSYTDSKGFEIKMDFTLSDASGNSFDDRGIMIDKYLYVVNPLGDITTFDSSKNYEVVQGK